MTAGEMRKLLEKQAAEIAALKRENQELKAKTGIPVRKRLPDTRPAITHKFQVGAYEGYMTVGLFEDGTPGELFVTVSKEGSTIGGLMDSVACLTSMALQYGVSLEVLARKFSHQRFEPSGWTNHPQIGFASSLCDYVFRWLMLNFGSKKPELTKNSETEAKAKSNNSQSTAISGDAPICDKCGALMERAGRCHRCPNCGETTGCG